MKTVAATCILVFFVISGFTQEDKIQWKRSSDMGEKKVSLFHSIQTANLPTAETLNRNEFDYEISHRFISPVDQPNAYFGIDGPAQIRMALSYAISDDLLMSIGRSNLDDNIDIRAKYKLIQIPGESLPMILAFQGGASWNTEVYDQNTGEQRDKTDSKNFQYYGQVIWNTMFFNKVGFGLVPSYVHNSNIYNDETQYSFTAAMYIQYYFLPMWSIFAETNTLVSGWRKQYNPITLGLEIETGGHFFSIFFTNSRAINPTQFLAGADLNLKENEWRLGFNITRILKFWGK